MRSLYGRIVSANEIVTAWAEGQPLGMLPIEGIYDPVSMVLIPSADGMSFLSMVREKTAEELAVEHDVAVVQQISGFYSQSEEIRLLNAAIEALASGKPLPQEYLSYRAKVEEIKAL